MLLLMNPATTFEKLLGEWLDVIDMKLAQRCCPLYTRPLLATIELIELDAISIKRNDPSIVTNKFPDYMDEILFRRIYGMVYSWYFARFEDKMNQSQSRTCEGATFIRETPYLTKIPLTTSKIEKPGETAWLCFHDSVQSSEDVLSWIQQGPNFKLLSAKDIKKARSITKEISNNLRSINIAVLGMDKSNEKISEMSQRILPRLQDAARSLAKADDISIACAFWPMQLACELALKCLSLQRGHNFKETHDLFYLFDNIPPPYLTFSRAEISKLPNCKEIINSRYSSAKKYTIKESFRAYRAAVNIVAATTSSFNIRFKLGNAKILLQLPPWARAD